MLYLPYHLWEDFQGRRDRLQCCEVGKKVCRKLFGMITFQRIQRRLCTLVCSLLLLHRSKDRRMASGVFLSVPFELLLWQFL